ncbi:hypothetical protein [Ruthenibacterium lactatiformans]|uniref:restriction endonuclease subunit S n=1 Tax=Ruthenibacterium lactatiformans TaxID=1550024 RepID=UPI001353E83E|nr:hypothetical protein [Ruthenibacterium lactatiformans]KAB5107786.1 hypothetical protein GAE13_24665 [Bacteroides thetaiotaomicron]MCQ5088161.1 hypothetical protein [Ruthenibacterium lactatiformans]
MIKRSDPQSNAPVMMLSAGNGFIMQSDKYSRDNAGQSLKKYILLKKGELAYNHGASKAKQFGCCYELQEEEARIPYVYHCFKVCDTEYTPYVALELNNPKMDKQLKRLVSSSVRMDGLLNISYEEYMSVQVYLPAYSEQKRIADFIEKLDERIAKQEQLIEALKKYKRGVFEAIFSRKLRLVPKEKQKDWKVFKLNEFASRITRKNNGATDIPLTISAQYGLIDQRDFFSKVVASADMSGYYLLRKGEYAYNRSTSNEYPFGSIKRLELYNEGAVSTLYLCFSINEKIIVSDFAKWYFESSQWYSSVNKICSEGARNHGLLNVPTDGFFNTTHILPSDIKEQMVIATFLSFIQGKLERSQENLDQLNQLRSGLMQKLFI